MGSGCLVADGGSEGHVVGDLKISAAGRVERRMTAWTLCHESRASEYFSPLRQCVPTVASDPNTPDIKT